MPPWDLTSSKQRRKFPSLRVSSTCEPSLPPFSFAEEHFHVETEWRKFWSSSCPLQYALTDFGYLESKPEDLRKQWGTYPNLVVLQILIFFSTISATIYFLESSNICFMHCPGFICTFSERYRVLQMTLSTLTLISALTKYGNKELCFY